MAVMLARPQRGHLAVRKLADYTLHLYASPAYLAARGAPAAREQLHEHMLIGYVPEFLYWPELDYLDEVQAGLEASLRSSSIGMQRQLILDGAGIGVLPDFIVADDETLVRLFPEEVEIARSFWLVTHPEMAKLARILAVSDMLRERSEALLGRGASVS